MHIWQRLNWMFVCPFLKAAAEEGRRFSSSHTQANPQRKLPKLIVVAAFDRDEDGELFAAYGPAEPQHEERAVRTAKTLAASHVGVIA